MPADYGLSAMTGIIPVTIMAGVNVAVIKELFPERYGKKRKSSKRKSQRTYRSSSPGFGSFRNLGL